MIQRLSSLGTRKIHEIVDQSQQRIAALEDGANARDLPRAERFVAQ
jgi:hypothetical protein